MMIPILIFAYNRSDKLLSLCSSLKNCEDASSFRYIFYIDGPKCRADIQKIENVIYVAKNFISTTNYPCEMHLSKVNKGLKNSIIDGVSSLGTSGSSGFIVLEDDLILGIGALKYLRHCLEKYRDDPSIGSISAFSYPLKHVVPGLYLLYRVNSWGWASWHSKVGKFFSSKSNFSHSWQTILKSSFAGIDIPYMYYRERSGFLDSWAIPFQIYLIENRLKTIYPSNSFVSNIGFDCGTHANGFSHNGRCLDSQFPFVERSNPCYFFKFHFYLIKYYLGQIADKVFNR